MTTLSVFTTVSGRQIKVSANFSKRTYTIYTESGKYRTFPMSKEEFNSCRHNTGNDWSDFLRANDYLKV